MDTATHTPATTINPDCHACDGTGEDQAFGGSCAECERRGTYRVASEVERHLAETHRDFTPGPGGFQRSTGASTAAKVATDKQVRFLRRLVTERIDTPLFDHVVLAASTALDRLDSTGTVMVRQACSEWIDHMLGQGHPNSQPTASTPTHPQEGGRTGRPNRYPGKCGDCGQWVEAETGVVEKVSGKWTPFHTACPDPTPAPTDDSLRPQAYDPGDPIDGEVLDLTVLPSGRYAVPGGDTRLKVQIDVVTDGKWDGWVFVKDAAEYGTGRRYGKQAPGASYSGDIVAELSTILTDPQAAMAAYGHLVGKCGRCGRQLEDEQSVARGIGPVCAGKMGW